MLSFSSRIVLATMLTLLLCLAHNKLHAQSDSLLSPFSLLDRAFGQLNPDHMANGVLFQSAYPLERITDFTGNHVPAPAYTATPKRFFNLCYALQSAVRDTSHYALFDGDYHQVYEERASSEVVLVAGMLTQGSWLLDTAYYAGWITTSLDSGRLFDTPTGGPQSYYTDTVFAFTPLADQLFGNAATFIFDSRYFYGNTPWPAAFEFDPGDGQGFRTLGFGDSLTVDLTGLDTVQLELRFAVGSQNLRAYASIVVPPPARPMNGEGFPRCFTDVPGVSIELQPADEECEESWFANTLIVVDGIDPSKMQAVDFEEAYSKYNNPEILVGGKTVHQNLIDKGYDFVFINFDDGGQSVQSTAQILKAAIRWINAEKARRGNAGDNIVIGHSMGGLTSKWALSEMARDKEDHGVSKFFSFDSPLRGAVIPLGLQLKLQYLLNLEIRSAGSTIRLGDSPKFVAADVALNSPAAKELLLFSVDADPFISIIQLDDCPWYKLQCFDKSAGATFSLDQATHLQFQAQFDALPPLDVPHIAISDGSRLANQVTGTTTAELPAAISSGGRIASLSINSYGDVPDNGRWPKEKHFETQFGFGGTARYSPGGFVGQAFLDIYLINPRIDVAFQRTPTSVVNHASWGLPNYDLAPGSHSDDGFPQLILAAGDLPAGGTDTLSELVFTVFNDHYVFVPTSSALNLPLALTATVNGCGPGITECITPDPDFIESRFLNATRNYEHVTFTPSIATALLARIPDAASGGAFASSTSPSTISSPYNFASVAGQLAFLSAPPVLYGVRDVSGNGAILVNRAGLIRNQVPGTDPEAGMNKFLLTLGNGNCGELAADITLQSGAKFKIGENPRTATVIALSGTRVTVQNGGLLEINDGSNFILRSNGPDGKEVS